jgi:hypothetical protein
VTKAINLDSEDKRNRTTDIVFTNSGVEEELQLNTE